MSIISHHLQNKNWENTMNNAYTANMQVTRNFVRLHILLRFVAFPKDSINKEDSRVSGYYITAVPAIATRASSIHINRETPTLADERRMTLGVAKMLATNQSVSFYQRE
jgi:hypothetical protein